MRAASLMRKTTSLTSLCPSSFAWIKASRTRGAWLSLTKGISAVKARSVSRGWNERCAMELAWTTMSCSSTTMSDSGTLENRASNRSEALSAAAWL